MGMPGGMELFVLVAVVVLLFGGKKIPELAKGMGQGIKNFKSALKEEEPAKTAEATTNSTEKIEEETVAKTTTSNETEAQASKSETKTV